MGNGYLSYPEFVEALAHDSLGPVAEGACGFVKGQKRDSDYYNNTENRRTKIGSYAIAQS